VNDADLASSRAALRIDIDELLLRLNRELDSSGQDSVAIASDGDCTLWRGDIGLALFVDLLSSGGVREAAREALIREAAVCQLDGAERMSAQELAQELLQANLDGRYADEPAFAMMAWAFAGWSNAELEPFCDKVLEGFGFDAAVFSHTRTMIGWAEQRDIPFYLVSASPHGAACAAARRLGLPTDRVIAMRPAERDGLLEPRLSERATYGEGKRVRLRQHIGKTPLLAALGDSSYDAAMMREAAVPIAVAPTDGALEVLGNIDGLVLLGVD